MEETKHLDEIDLKVLVTGILRNYKVLLLTAFAFAFVAAFLSRYVLTKKYESYALILPSDRQENSASSALQGMASSMGLTQFLGQGTATDSLARYGVILRSRSILEMAAANPAISEKLLEKKQIDPLASEADRILQGASYMGQGAFFDSEDQVIRVRFRDPDPVFAKLATSALLESLQKFLDSTMVARAKSTENFVAERLIEAEETLKEIETASLAMQKSEGVVQFPSQSSLAISSAANLRSQLMEKDLEINMYKEILKNSSEVKRLESERRQISSQIEKLMSGESKNLANKNGVKAVDIFTPIRNIPSLGMEIARSERGYLSQVKVVELLRQQLEISKIETKKSEPSFQVIDPPILSRVPTSPKLSLNVLLGFFLGLSLATLFVVFFTQFSTTKLPKSFSKIVVVTQKSAVKESTGS